MKKSIRLFRYSFTLGGVLLVAAPGMAQQFDGPPDLAAAPGGAQESYDEEGRETLAQGPMHEAFASPFSATPEPGEVIDQAPPQPINEIAPDQRPVGDHVVWIPGYWGWDPEPGEFIWISGLWRNVPEDRRWVPGYWTETQGGFQWVPGLWVEEQTQQLSYLPMPPASQEHGPNVAAPEGDYFWVPGHWEWQTEQYDWHPGYWAECSPGWVWNPAYYSWSPYGYVYSSGYWDYQLANRGVLYAPVTFQRPLYQQQGYRYTPSLVLNSSAVLLNLFVSPRYNHYYYGNYYGYRGGNNFGLYPWYSYEQRANAYDPLLTYYQWQYGRQNINFVNRLQNWNQFFVSNSNYRPARTYTAQRALLSQLGNGGANAPFQPNAITIASTLQQFSQNRGNNFQFQQVNAEQRQRYAEDSRNYRQLQTQRNEFERAGLGNNGNENLAGNPGNSGRNANSAGRSFNLPRNLAGIVSGNSGSAGANRGNRQVPARPTPDNAANRNRENDVNRGNDGDRGNAPAARGNGRNNETNVDGNNRIPRFGIGNRGTGNESEESNGSLSRDLLNGLPGMNRSGRAGNDGRSDAGTGDNGQLPGRRSEGRNSGDREPGMRGPGRDTNENGPNNNLNPNQPGGGNGNDRPGMIPGVGTPDRNPGRNLPGGDPNADRPGEIPGRGRPGMAPGAGLPGDNDSGAGRSGPGRRPGLTPGSGLPGSGLPGSGLPGVLPGAGTPNPDRGPGAGRPDRGPGAENPGRGSGGVESPGRGPVAPGAGNPGTVAPGASRPGAVAPGASRPGTVAPGASRPGAAAPGAGNPGRGASGPPAAGNKGGNGGNGGN